MAPLGWVRELSLGTGIGIEDFLARDWPADTELVDCEAVLNDPSFRHQKIALRIARALSDWTDAEEGRGEAGVGGNWTVAPGQVYKPDAWWATEQGRPGADAVRSDTPPTLAIEVRSPGTWHLDIGRKRTVYEEVGVAELWLVDTLRNPCSSTNAASPVPPRSTSPLRSVRAASSAPRCSKASASTSPSCSPTDNENRGRP